MAPTTTELESLVAAGGQVLEAPADIIYPADWFKDPGFTEPSAMTVEQVGDLVHVSGHLATWETCHIGYLEECKAPPASATDYAYFLTGEVDTDAGPVAVGQITMGAGHADLKMGIVAAAAHYDQLCASVADIAVGEDSTGIWYNGALRPTVSQPDLYALRASGAVSGDWRGVRVGIMHSREMIAALAVNVPGFPVPRRRFSATRKSQVALVAAGIVIPEQDDMDSRIDQALARRERAAAFATVQNRVRKVRASVIERRIQKGGK